MEFIFHKLLSSFLIITLYSAISSTCYGDYHCSDFLCGSLNSNLPFVGYPFKFLNQSKEECWYPGYDLGCDSGENISLTLSNSGKFNVEHIDYFNQEIQLQDPRSCLPGRVFELLSNSSNSSPFSPFSGENYKNYTFLSCRNPAKLIRNSRLPIIHCLSNDTVLVIATSSPDFVADMATLCDLIGTVAVPQSQDDVVNDDIAATDFTLTLSWKYPDLKCQECQKTGGFCRFSGGETVCSSDDDNADLSSGWKRWEKFLRIVGFYIFLPVAIFPAFFMLIMACLEGIRGRRNLAGNTRAMRFSEMIQQLRVKPGLEDHVIESYPKMVVDEELGNVAGDVMCCICLDEYVAGDILRSLPECKHFFHVECIDGWLKINRTCPVCRV